jgi:hypothetical protein
MGIDAYWNTLHNILLVYLFDPQASLHDVSIVMFLSYPALKELDMIWDDPVCFDLARELALRTDN